MVGMDDEGDGYKVECFFKVRIKKSKKENQTE